MTRKTVAMRASMTNKGCHFGSMAGSPPKVGVSSGTSIAYRQGGVSCDCLAKIRFATCAEQYQYLKDKNLLFNCKLTGGIGRQPFTKNCAAK